MNFSSKLGEGLEEGIEKFKEQQQSKTNAIIFIIAIAIIFYLFFIKK